MRNLVFPAMLSMVQERRMNGSIITNGRSTDGQEQLAVRHKWMT